MFLKRKADRIQLLENHVLDFESILNGVSYDSSIPKAEKNIKKLKLELEGKVGRFLSKKVVNNPILNWENANTCADGYFNRSRVGFLEIRKNHLGCRFLFNNTSFMYIRKWFVIPLYTHIEDYELLNRFLGWVCNGGLKKELQQIQEENIRKIQETNQVLNAAKRNLENIENKTLS